MEDIEKSLRSSFCVAANSVSQLYVSSLHLQKQSYISGYQKAIEQMMQLAASKAFKTSDSKIVVPLEALFLFSNSQLQMLQAESGTQQNQQSQPIQSQASAHPPQQQNLENTDTNFSQNRPISDLNQPPQPPFDMHQNSSEQQHQYIQQQQHQQSQNLQNQVLPPIANPTTHQQNFNLDFKESSRKRPIGFAFEPPPSLIQNGLSYNEQNTNNEQQAFPYFYYSEQVAKRGRFELPISQQ
jgi:hypothetical protein